MLVLRVVQRVSIRLQLLCLIARCFCKWKLILQRFICWRTLAGITGSYLTMTSCLSGMVKRYNPFEITGYYFFVTMIGDTRMKFNYL